MIIFPIVNRNRILNVEIKLKDAKKIRTGASFFDAKESDVIVNGRNFSTSTYYRSKDPNAVLDFIRNHSLVYRRDYLVTTRVDNTSSLYDVYQVSQPQKKVSSSLDQIYSSVLTDMRMELPGLKKGRYLSFEKIGLGEELTDDKIAKLEKIVKEVSNQKEMMKLLKEEQLMDFVDILDFMQQFDCTVISDSSIAEDQMQTMLKSLEKLNTKDARGLKNYYNIALSNRDIYTKLSYINKLLYQKPLSLIFSQAQKEKIAKEKQLIKTIDTSLESEYSKVA